MNFLNCEKATLEQAETTCGVRWALVEDGKTLLSVEGPHEVIAEKFMGAVRAMGFAGISKDGLAYG